MMGKVLLMLIIITARTEGEDVDGKGPVCEYAIYSDMSRSGTVMSPNYPLPYVPDTFCVYEFQGRDEERVRITFQDFDLYSADDDSIRCEDSDSLGVYVFVDERLEKIDTYCGNELPRPIMSNGPWMRMEFQSRLPSRRYRGFNASYDFTTNYAINTGFQSSNNLCAFNIYSNETKHGYFHSPNFPGIYPRNTRCQYFFHGALSEQIKLHFNYFEIEGVSSCEAQTSSDFVEFSNYNGIDRKFKRYCGELDEFDVESDSSFFRVTFQSNGRLDGTGFNATYGFFREILPTTKKLLDHIGKSAPHRNDGDFRQSSSAVIVLLFMISILNSRTWER